MPAFNEGERIYHNLEETYRTLESLDFDFEIILVDDGSSDNTFAEAQRFAEIQPERVIVRRRSANDGKGRALRFGHKFVRGEIVVFLDSDLELHPRQIRILIDVMKETRSDIVVGSKRHVASMLSYPWRR